MPIEFDPSQPFKIADGATLDTLVPLTHPQAASPATPTFDPSKPFTTVATPTPAAPASGPIFDANQPATKLFSLDEFKAAPNTALVKDKDFSPVQFGAQNLESLQKDPVALGKLVDLYRQQETQGTTLREKLSAFTPGAIVKAGGTLLTGAGAAVKNSFEMNPVAIAARAAGGDNTETKQRAAEMAASLETAGQGTADLLRRSGRAVKEGLTGAKASMTPDEWRARFFDDVAGVKQTEAVGQGNGAVMQGLGVDADKLKQVGVVVDPDQIQKLSVITDPINYVPLGATVGFVSKVAGKVTRGVVATTLSAEQAAKMANILNSATSTVGAVASQTAGELAKGVGTGIEKTGDLAKGVVNSLGGAASGLGIGGILGGDIYSGLGGAAVAKGVPKLTQTLGQTIKAGGEMLTGQRAVPTALSTTLDAAKGAVVGGAKGLGEGLALTLPFEVGARPDEEQGILGMAALGAATRGGLEAAHPVAKAAGIAAQNHLAETIFKHVEQPEAPESPSYGTEPSLDSAHAAQFEKLKPVEQKLVNWGRGLLRDSGGEIYVVPPEQFKRETGRDGLGYAVTAGEKLNPDGTSTPLFRILLNGSSEALPHEFFHALEALDAPKAKDFIATVDRSLTPEQRDQFENYYNARLNAGLPESQWTRRLGPGEVSREIAGEVFSRALLSEDLSQVAPQVKQSAALFISGLFEKLGAPLAKAGANPKEAGVSTLGIRPGVEATKQGHAWLKDIIGRVRDDGSISPPETTTAFKGLTAADITPATISRKPLTGVIPTPKPTPTPAPKPTVPGGSTPLPHPVVPAPTPTAPNIRTTRAKQNDFAGKRAEVTNTEAALQSAANTGDADVVSIVKEVAPHVESGTALEITHQGAKSGGFGTGRTGRRSEQEATYIAEGTSSLPEKLRESHQKIFVPVRWEVSSKGPQLLAMSLDKVLANAGKVVEAAADRNLSKKIPYATEAGKLTDSGWNDFVHDFQAYSENQANGYRGDGQRLKRPKEDVGLSIPAENPGYNPVSLTPERANFQNLVQGLNPPLTAREGKQSSAIVPGNVKGAILAEVNARTPERPTVIRPEDIQKQTFKSGREIVETNPLRNELAAAGVPVRELIEVTERVNAKDIETVTPRPDLNFKAPVTDTVRGGFLPTPEEILGDSPTEFIERAKTWKGGQATEAYRVGLAITKPEELAALKTAQETASAARKERMAARDINGGVSAALKAQFFREAYEAATDTGSAAGENGWRRAFPDAKPAFAQQASFLPKPEGSETIRDISENYAKSAGIQDYTPHTSYDKMPPELGSKLAEFYENAKSNPEDPKVKASYDALAFETLAQLDALESAGYRVEPWTGEGEPYKTSAEAVADVRDNKHLFFLKTEGNINSASDNPMLTPWRDGLVINDAFRAVHDFFGHAKEGYQFGPRGEFNAWKAHSAMFTPEAQGALAAETLAQNAWVNFGPHKELAPKERPFAEQKNIIVPESLIAEAKAAGRPEGDFLPQTEAGRALSEEGYDFQLKGQKGYRVVDVVKAGDIIGSVTSHQLDPKTATIDLSVIQKDNRGKGLGTAAYRELLTQLKKDGVEDVTGSFISPEPIRIRKGLFGTVDDLQLNGEKVSIEEALTAAKNAKHSPHLLNITGKNKILPDSSFLPKSDEIKPRRVGFTMADIEARWVKEAATKTADSSKTSKANPTAWILPDGEVHPLTQNFHEHDLAQNRTEYNKKFGTDFSKKADESDRLDAINRGFVRMRYIPQHGTMTVEVNAGQWGKQKKNVEAALLSHADKIDKLHINLLDDGGNVSDDASDFSVFRANSREAAIKKVVQEVKPPSDMKAVQTRGPSLIQQARAFTAGGEGDFLPHGGDENAPLLDLGLPPESEMKQKRIAVRVKDRKEKFPEALVPQYAKDDAGNFVVSEDGKPKPRAVEYQLMDSPLAKEAAKGVRGDDARQAAYTDALANKLVDTAKEASKHQDIQAGVKWYSTARTRLKKLLGDDSKFFSELLGATSARTPVDINFRFSLDAYNQFKAGKFDAKLKKYREGKKNWDTGNISDFVEETGNKEPNRGQYLDWWVKKNDLTPTQSNGRKFGANSRSVLRVLDGSWADEVQGPKTPNFAGNLSGHTFEATIDVWAARLLHRLSNENNPKRWRILPENETGVTDADFYIGQDAYRKAATKLGMKPDALQAILWFYEKNHWEHNGWTRGAGAEKSDFNSLLSETERKPNGALQIRKAQKELAFSLGNDDIQARRN